MDCKNTQALGLRPLTKGRYVYQRNFDTVAAVLCLYNFILQISSLAHLSTNIHTVYKQPLAFTVNNYTNVQLAIAKIWQKLKSELKVKHCLGWLYGSMYMYTGIGHH